MPNNQLADRPVTRSVVEETVGILWAILACITPYWPVFYLACFMATVSLGAAIYYGITALRARQS